MSFRERVYEVVRRIPPGCVATYGQVASLAGRPRAARAVGSALRNAGGEAELPWHRVINAQGYVSPGNDVHRPTLQRALLEGEGVELDARGRVDLSRYRWEAV